MLYPPFDLIFISYDEPEAEQNWQRLKAQVPGAKRVHGITGIARAWKQASELAETSHFFTMDGDSQLVPGFNFHLEDFQGESDQRVHVYRCRNRVNGLVYGYGSIHLFPTQLVRNFNDLDVVDFTLSVATEGFRIQPAIASVTCFNTGPYISWKSGFREASKLASKTNAYASSAEPDPRSLARLKVWCSVGLDVAYGDWCVLGARMGALFGFENAQTPEKLALISDHEWFREQFDCLDEKSMTPKLLELKRSLSERFGFRCEEFDAITSRSIKDLFLSF